MDAKVINSFKVRKRQGCVGMEMLYSLSLKFGGFYCAFYSVINKEFAGQKKRQSKSYNA